MENPEDSDLLPPLTQGNPLSQLKRSRTSQNPQRFVSVINLLGS